MRLSVFQVFKYPLVFGIFTLFTIYSQGVSAQDLEPRTLTNVPVGSNFVLIGYGHSRGNVLLDPSIPIEGLDARLNLGVMGYVRAINFFGLSAKIDILTPFGGGNWTGNYEGVDTATSRNGFGDPSARLSVNFIGAPALNLKDYKGYKQNTIVGASIRVRAPLGQYNSAKLLNLGSNRWAFILKAGVSHYLSKWIFEIYAAARFFTINNNFFGGNELTQKPFYSGTLHVIRMLPYNMWLAVDGGYGFGAQSEINGELRDNRMSTFRFGLTYAISLKKAHTLKLAVFSGRRFEKGPDFDSLVLAYNFRWNRKTK